VIEQAVMTQWQIFTEFSRKFPENLTLLLVQNAQLSIFATAHTAEPLSLTMTKDSYYFCIDLRKKGNLN